MDGGDNSQHAGEERIGRDAGQTNRLLIRPGGHICAFAFAWVALPSARASTLRSTTRYCTHTDESLRIIADIRRQGHNSHIRAVQGVRLCIARATLASLILISLLAWPWPPV